MDSGHTSAGTFPPPMDPKYIPLPLVAPGHTNDSVTEKISHMTLEKETPRAWWLSLLIALSMAGGLGVAILGLLFVGIGLWGPNVPVGWGMDIINFVWWIGIGHAGTLISAILLLFKQKWRNSINRFAEAKPYDAPNHRGVAGLRLQGFEEGGPTNQWVGLSQFLPGGGAGPGRW